jgi:peptidoglycan hydrolase-like protein with peptidoglycan-binding domain
MDTSQTTGTAARSAGSDGRQDPLWKSLHRAQRLRAFTAAGFLLVALSGCSEDPAVTPVEAAQAEVAAKEKALAEAEAEATAAAAGFCEASSTYITALDRYGDVLNETAPTVGDVKDAGKDLTAPAEDTKAAADAAVSAREQVTQAEQDLADAEAALAAAEASAAGETPAEVQASQVPSPEPAAAPATVARVEQAEAEFAAAQAGITDKTPLVQAAEQFNSAAVALEMSWLALFAEVGCLTDDQQEQAANAVRDYTIALQKDLADAGYYEGEVDGVYGPDTVAAVQALQEANGLPETGTMDKATEAALRAELEAAGAAAAQEEMASTAALQQTLKLAGYWDGPVDGVWTDELTDALKEFQTDLGVEPTGEVDAATIAAFEQALAAAQATPSPGTPSASPTPSPTQPSDEPSAVSSASS